MANPTRCFFHLRPVVYAALALWAVAPGTRGQVAATRRNLLVNGGFEEALSGWTPQVGQYQVIEDADVARIGTTCVTGEVVRDRTHCQLNQRVPVSAGNLYEFEIRARATNRTKLVLWVLRPGAETRSMVTSWEKVPGKWTRYTTPITIQKDGQLELQLIAPSAHGAPPGRMWLDGAALYETELPAEVVLSNTDGFADEPALAAGADGAVYAAWNPYRDGSDSLVAARLVATDGGWRPAAQWTVVPPGKGTYLLHPRMIPWKRGAALVYAAEVAEDSWDIRAASLSSEGGSRSLNLAGADAINIKPAGAAHDETLWVAWESNRDGSRQIYLGGISDGRVLPAQRVSSGESSNYAPSVAALPDGTVAVAWHAFRNANYDVFVRRRSPDGTWRPEQRLTRAAGVDRHVSLTARGDGIWMVYEHTTSAGYRIGASSARRLMVAQVSPDGRCLAPLGLATSPLKGRCEAGSLVFDERGRLWVSHLRPRGRRSGWDAFVVGYTGQAWTGLIRTSGMLGMDRRPPLAAVGGQLVLAVQKQLALKSFADEELAAKETSEIRLATVRLDDAPAAVPCRTEPLQELTTRFEPAAERQRFGDADAGAPPSIDYQGKTLYLVYGDLHEHTDVSQCNRLGDQSIDESYQHMRDINRLDFAAATDHGYNVTPYLWNYTAKLARVNDDPGRFLTFLGEEWTSTFEEYSDEHPYGFYGHRNLILADAYFPRWWNARNRQTPAEVWAELRRRKADFVHIPHQIADTGNVPTAWEFADEEAQPVAEIFQVRGSYEYKGTVREAKRSTPAGWFIQDAWARGIVIGVIASPDHGGGIGKACVYVPELSRKAVLEALRARHCFGSTAARVQLDVRVNGHLMGEKIPAAGTTPVQVDVAASCPANIARIEVCRNNEFVYSVQPGAPTASFTFRDAQPVAGRSYYYVRLIQEDDEIAWTSPVWLGYP